MLILREGTAIISPTDRLMHAPFRPVYELPSEGGTGEQDSGRYKKWSIILV
jgi:hypothetical protein